MTTIDKLGILGIRSYGTDEETLIRFEKPLTILLGRNGSGKSTIIEAVKMATTGDLPPLVDKGAAFIHDPRIDNETETKAKIRLMFTTIRGDKYIISRHFQLGLKRLPRSAAGYKTEFKTLDQTLKKLHQNGGSARAYRSSDLNALLPDVMRVSKPVLNNVIFVHQEDSLWPLSDSKKLKEKFDEIFAATRYTRALDIIRKYRKDQAAELKTVNVELMHYEDKVKRLEAVRGEVDEITVRHDELKRGATELENEIATLQEGVTSAEVLAHEYLELSSELRKLRVEASCGETKKAEIYSELHPHLAGIDDESIRRDIERLQTSLDNAGEKDKERNRRIEELHADIEMKQAELYRRQTRKGMLEQQAKMQRDRLKQLERIKNEILSSRDLKEQLNKTGDLLQLANLTDNVERWSQTLDDLRRDAEQHVKKLTEDGNSTLDAASANHTDIKVRLEAAKAEVMRKNSSIDKGRERLVKIRDDLRELEQTQVSIKDADGRMRALQTAFTEKKQSGQSGILEREISSLKKKILSVKEDLESARRTRDLLQQDQTEQARLDVARRNVKTAQGRLNSAIEEFLELQISAVRELTDLDADPCALDDVRSQLSSIGVIRDNNATDKYQTLDEISAKILTKRDVLLEKTEREYAGSKTALQSAEFQKLEAERNWSSQESEVRNTKSEIQELLKALQELRDPPEELKTMLSCASTATLSQVDLNSFGSEWFFDAKKPREVLHNAISKAKQRVSQQETGLMLAIGDLEQFEEHPKHMCPACGMVSSKKVGAMRSNLQSRVEIYKDPERLQQAKQRLRALERSFEDIKRLEALTAGATDLNSKLTTASAEKNDSMRRFETAKATHSEAESKAAKAKQMGTGATQQVLVKQLELNQLLRTFRHALQELDTLQARMSLSREGERSLTEVNSEVTQLEEDLSRMQDILGRTQASLDNEKEDLHRMEVRFREAKQFCLEQETKSERLKNLFSEKENINSSLRTIEEEIAQDRTKCRMLEVDLREAEEDFQRTRGENATLMDHANAKLSKRRDIAHVWADCQHEINAYMRSGKDKELQTLIQSLDAITLEVSSKTAERQKCEEEQRTASDSRKAVEDNLRNLRENQKYRLLEQELQTKARSVRHFEDKLAGLEQRAGEVPSMKVKTLTDRINEKKKDLAATLGRKEIFTERYKEKLKELKEVEKEGSRRKFDECRIKKQTMTLASGDLDRYHRALDQALMAFHTLKMNSINRTIKELWQQTYRGTDIEEIEITSDHGDTKGGAIKRNFNYRVQMRQGGAVLDMRGRCSAGQKVLACLVIRLALAESFCADCGILALDEPTTNLDRENIQSLATALKRIIDLRRKQRNFQLILITHDQEFIEMLGAREFCNEYYTVYKDGSGISRAKLQDLRTML